ncbi:MAG: hypothetical protein KBF01_03305 [Proteocatella sp.]|nr:hypothetical protein [Proteocatella sp.]
MASSLTDRQLILLDNLIYLKWENMENPTDRNPKVSDIITYFHRKTELFWKENTKEETKTVTQQGATVTITIKSYPGEIEKQEWIELLGIM